MDALDQAAHFRIQFGRPDLIGALVGVGILGPLFGQIAGVPSRYIADLAVVAAVVVASIDGELKVGIPRSVAILLDLIAVYFCMVVASAQPAQWAFLLHPGNWRGHSDDYGDAKLLMFIVTFIGPVVSALVIMFSASKERIAAATLWTVVIIGAAAVLRLATFWGLLVGTNDVVAQAFFQNGSRGFSTVSYGLLFLFAGVASLFLPVRLISAVFVAACFILHRRTETAILLLAIIAYGANEALLKGARRKLITIAGIIVLAVGLSAVLQNGGSLIAWERLGSSVETRAMIATAGIASSKAVSTDSGGYLLGVLFGHGLGSSATADAQWPHNLLLETFIEGGVATLIILLASLAWGFFISRPKQIIAESGLALCTAALTVAMFAFSLKSTDVTSSGTLIAWMLVTVSLGASVRRPQSLPPTKTRRLWSLQS